MKSYIIRKPVITERTLLLANQDNTYTFFVERTANKKQIQSAVEELYTVNVVKVRTIVTPSVSRRTGKRRLERTKNAQKKALVTLKKGQTISLFDIGGEATA